MKNPYMTRQALTASLAFAGFTPLQVVRNRG